MPFAASDGRPKMSLEIRGQEFIMDFLLPISVFLIFARSLRARGLSPSDLFGIGSAVFSFMESLPKDSHSSSSEKRALRIEKAVPPASTTPEDGGPDFHISS